MDFSHLSFYDREVTLADGMRQPQAVPFRSTYKFAYGRETLLEQALALIDKLSLEELKEVLKFVKKRGKMVAARREEHLQMQRLYEEMWAALAAGEGDDAGDAGDAGQDGDAVEDGDAGQAGDAAIAPIAP